MIHSTWRNLLTRTELSFVTPKSLKAEAIILVFKKTIWFEFYFIFKKCLKDQPWLFFHTFVSCNVALFFSCIYCTTLKPEKFMKFTKVFNNHLGIAFFTFLCCWGISISSARKSYVTNFLWERPCQSHNGYNFLWHVNIYR